MESVTTDPRAIWRAFKTRIQATWFWRVFGVCAMKKLWTKFMVAVSISGSYLIAFFGLELLNPVLTLEQMNRTEGVLLSVHHTMQSRHWSKIVIQTDGGVILTFRGSMIFGEDIPLRNSIGRRITIWSQPHYQAVPPFFYEEFQHVRSGNSTLVDYGRVEGSLRLHGGGSPFWFKFSIALAIFPLLIVSLACRTEWQAP